MRPGYQPGEPIGLDMARQGGPGRQASGRWSSAITPRPATRSTCRRACIDVATGKRLDVATVEDRYTDDVRPLFDQLATNLLDLSGAPSGVRADVARADHEFAGGVPGLPGRDRGSQPVESVVGRAGPDPGGTLDSTFALAYYKLALTRGWLFGQFDSLGHQSIQKASRNRGRLTDHDR